jgi:photosystem II stability/assembly factor-like uncharacterized protein
MRVVRGPDGCEDVFVFGDVGRLWLSRDYGQTWRRCRTGIRWWIENVAAHGDTICALGLFSDDMNVSHDGGESWQRVRAGSGIAEIHLVTERDGLVQCDDGVYALRLTI